jgi:type IV pilus assembly protein PilN
MIRINLLAAERPSRKKKAAAAAPGTLQAYLILGLFTVGTAVVCAGWWWLQEARLRRLDQDIAAAQERQRQLMAIKRQVDELEAKRAMFQRKIDLIERLKAQQSGPVHMLDEVSKALPEFVWLTNLDQAGVAVNFAGQSNGLTAAADFIAALQRSGYFPVVDLAESSESNAIVTFRLSSTFQTPEMRQQEQEAKARAAAQAPRPGAPR